MCNSLFSISWTMTQFGFVLEWGHLRAASKWAAGVPEADWDRQMYSARLNVIHRSFLLHAGNVQTILFSIVGCMSWNHLWQKKNCIDLEVTYVCRFILLVHMLCLFVSRFLVTFLTRMWKRLCPKKDLFELKCLLMPAITNSLTKECRILLSSVCSIFTPGTTYEEPDSW